MGDNPVHETAVSAEAAVEKLATQLGAAGAPPDTVKGVSQMADVLREIVKAVGAPDPAAGNPDEMGGPEPTGAPDPNPVGAVADSMGA